jgi:hypothetical protein
VASQNRSQTIRRSRLVPCRNSQGPRGPSPNRSSMSDSRSTRSDLHASLRVAAAALLVLAAGLACSASAPDEPESPTTLATSKQSEKGPTAHRRYLKWTDVQRYSPNSPRRAVLTFWYAVQQRDMVTAYRLLDSSFPGRGTLTHFADFLLAEHGRWLVRPQVVAIFAPGREANVTVMYSTPTDPRARTTFNLRRRPTGWKIYYEYYLSTRLNAKLKVPP